MKSLSVVHTKDKIGAAFDEIERVDPSVCFVFAAPSVFRDGHALEEMKARLAGRTVIGCSTAGEIGNRGVFAGYLSVLGIHFNQVRVKTAVSAIARSADSFEAGKEVGDKLRDNDLRAVFLLGPGTHCNGSALTEGVLSAVGSKVVISGGLAGDETDFKETYTICGDQIYTDHVVAVGLYGDALVVSCGSEGGWRPFGPARKVTKIDENVLLELDGKPALRLYKQYLGDKARELPASGLSYPFAVLRSDRSTSGIIRSALSIDVQNEALILAGNIREGSQVCLMHADTAALTQGAAQAAAEALRTHAGPEENGCALLVSCIGRRMVYGIDAEEEVEAVSDSFLPGTPIAGFYSYGEICSYGATGRTEFHNQTMTITYITEREGV